jgi:hypothetical protein
MFRPDKRRMGHGSERTDRYFQILTVLYEQKIGIDESAEVALTMQQIARKIGLAPSQHVREMLYTMYNEGWVSAETVTRKNGMIVVYWSHRDGIEFGERWQEKFTWWYETMQTRFDAAVWDAT